MAAWKVLSCREESRKHGHHQGPKTPGIPKGSDPGYDTWLPAPQNACKWGSISPKKSPVTLQTPPRSRGCLAEPNPGARRMLSTSRPDPTASPPPPFPLTPEENPRPRFPGRTISARFPQEKPRTCAPAGPPSPEHNPFDEPPESPRHRARPRAGTKSPVVGGAHSGHSETPRRGSQNAAGDWGGVGDPPPGLDSSPTQPARR